MSLLHESVILTALRQTFKKHIIEFENIEPSYKPGLADAYYSTEKGVDGWIELKRIMASAYNNGTIEIPYRPGQYAWLKRHADRGCNVFLFVIICNGPYKGTVFVFDKANIRLEYSKLDFVNRATIKYDYFEPPTSLLLDILNNTA